MAVFSYDDLRTKYEDFMDPKVSIEIGGVNLTFGKENLGVSDVDVEMTCGFEASIATFWLYDCYDMDRSMFLTSKIKKYILLGSSVVINIGYGSSVREIFRGFIAKVNFSFQKESMPGVEITAMDIKGIMMSNNYSKQIAATTYSEAVNKILQEEYAKLQSLGIVTNVHVTDTPDAAAAAAGGLGGALPGGLGAAAGGLAGAAGGLAGNLTGAVSGVAGNLAGAAGGALGSVTSAASGALGSVTSAAGGALGNVTSAASGLAGGALGSVAGAAAGLAGGALGGVAGAASGLAGGALGSVTSAASGALGSVAGAASGALGSLTGAASGALGSLAGGASGALGSLAGGASGALGSLAGGASGALGSLAGGAGGALGSLAGGAGGALGGVAGMAGGSTDKTIEMVYESDYEFIVKAAKKFNYEFFAIGGDVYFRKAKEDTEVLMELSPATGLHDMSVEYDVTGLVKTVEVRSVDVGKGRLLSAKQKSQNKISQGSRAKQILSGSKKVYLDPSVSSAEDAGYRADYLLEDMTYRYGTLEAEVIGLPELTPGRFIRLTSLGDAVSNLFYLVSVRHILSDDGYVTKITGKAAKLDDGMDAGDLAGAAGGLAGNLTGTVSGAAGNLAGAAGGILNGLI